MLKQASRHRRPRSTSGDPASSALNRIPGLNGRARAHLLQLSAATLLILLTGCANARYETVRVLDVLPGEQKVADAFTPGERILSGFDETSGPASPEDWRSGDEILYGLEITNGSHKIVRFIRVELRTGVLSAHADVIVLPPSYPSPTDAGDQKVFVRARPDDGIQAPQLFSVEPWSMTMLIADEKGEKHRVTRSSDAILAAVHLHDNDGHKLQTAYTLAPEAYLRRGFYAACMTARHLDSPMFASDPNRADAVADVFPALYGLGQTIQQTPNVVDVLRVIVPMPSILSLIAHGGVEFAIKGNLGDVAREDRTLPALEGGRHALRFPVDIELNGSPAIRCMLSVIRPSPPFHLCGGVIGLDGVQAKDPSRHFMLRLLAARRGPAEGEKLAATIR